MAVRVKQVFSFMGPRYYSLLSWINTFSRNSFFSFFLLLLIEVHLIFYLSLLRPKSALEYLVVEDSFPKKIQREPFSVFLFYIMSMMSLILLLAFQFATLLNQSGNFIVMGDSCEGRWSKHHFPLIFWWAFESLFTYLGKSA